MKRLAGGPTPTEASYRARGLVQVKVRMPVEWVRRLDDLCDAAGESRTVHLMRWIRLEEEVLDEIEEEPE